jgi:hypothetical protein
VGGNVGIRQESEIKLVGVDRGNDGRAGSVVVTVLYTDTDGTTPFH